MESQKQKQPSLKRIAEFEKALIGYKPSPESLKTLRSTKLVLLVGPTAAGRNALMDLLTKTGRYLYIASDTTRPRRINNGILEKNGVEYWFKTEDEVLDGIKKGKYIEAAIIHKQQVSGIHIERLELASKEAEISLKEVEVNGCATYHSYKPDTLCIFLLPPSFDVWMQRLRGRGNMEMGEMRRRLESAQNEIATALGKDYYTFIINNEIHEAADLVDRIASGESVDEHYQDQARSYAEQLAIDVKLYLNA